MPQIFDVIANENARYKRNELEFLFTELKIIFLGRYMMSLCSIANSMKLLIGN